MVVADEDVVDAFADELQERRFAVGAEVRIARVVARDGGGDVRAGAQCDERAVLRIAVEEQRVTQLHSAAVRSAA